MSPSRHFDSSERFDVIRKLGAGGMGIVLLAEDRVLKRRVVLKQLKRATPKGEQRLEREAQAISRIDHVNVMKVFDIVEREDEVFVVMEYIRGRTLSELIADGPLPVNDAVAFAIQIAHGLHAVHAEGLIHRDLKPANIMVTDDGTVKILDFGLAHFADRTTLNTQSRVMGTPAYMSPEQAAGREVGKASDLFALGVVLYELLTGKLPYGGITGPELIAQIMSAVPLPPRERNPSIPQALDAIVCRMLEKEPGDRFLSASDFARALELITEEKSKALHATTVELDGGTRQRHLPGRLPVASILALLGLALWLLMRGGGDQPGGPVSLLILPFEFEQADPGHVWLSTGVMDQLIEALEPADGIQVVSRQTVTSALEAKPPVAAGISPEHAQGVAARIAANYVLTGEIISSAAQATAGGPVEIRAALREFRSGSTIERWEIELLDLNTEFLDAMDRLAGEVAQDLGVSLGKSSDAPEVDLRHTRSVSAQRHFEEGLQAYRRQDFDAAEAGFKAAVAADSTYVRAYWYLFRTESDDEEATKALNRAMVFRLSSPEPLRSIVRATHLARLGERDQAIAVYEQILEQHPSSIEARLALARLYSEADRWADAIGEYEAARVLNPFDYSYFHLFATSLIELGRTRDAIRLVESWREDNPREIPPLLWLARLKTTVGEGLEALALCDSIDAIAEGGAAGMRGAVLRDVGRVAEAEVEFLRLKDNLPARWRPYTAQMLLAHLELTRGRPEQGIAWAEEAVAIQDDPYARHTAGILSVRIGDLEAAQRHLDAIAGAIGDDYADTTLVQEMGTRRWYFSLAGEIAHARGELARALRMHRTAARYSGRWDGADFNEALARCYLDAGDTTSAIAAFEESISLQKTYPNGALGLAEIHISQGRPEQARQVLAPLVKQWQQADADYIGRQRLDRLLARIEDK